MEVLEHVAVLFLHQPGLLTQKIPYHSREYAEPDHEVRHGHQQDGGRCDNEICLRHDCGPADALGLPEIFYCYPKTSRRPGKAPAGEKNSRTMGTCAWRSGHSATGAAAIGSAAVSHGLRSSGPDLFP